jgi:hypothetical protein
MMSFYETVKYEDYLFAYYMLVTRGVFDHEEFQIPLLHPRGDFCFLEEDIDLIHEYMGNLQLQSEPVMDVPEGSEEQQEIVGFTDSNIGQNVGQMGNVDNIVSSIHTGDYEISRFLERPVLITSVDIPQGEAYSDREIQPWYDFFNTTSVKNKLQNYAFIQCDLNIKVVVKCSPFIYGAYGLSYHAQQGLTGFQRYDDNLEINRIPFSQRMGIIIEPHKNKGGEFTLPFFHYKNWLELTNTQEVRDFGRLVLYHLAPLKSANGQSTKGCTINLYAWASNIKLAGCSSASILQSTLMKDATPAVDALTKNEQYGKGPVSKVASTVASISETIEDVPIIGPFAKVASFGSKLIGGIASIFGFSNVPVIDNVEPFKDVPFHAFANAEISVPMEKLSIDPKNELTIDPRTVGLEGHDELSIDRFCRRQSFMQEEEWLQSFVKNDYFMAFNVSPAMRAVVENTDDYTIQETPLGVASTLFSNWRGEIIYTFKIIKSQYHTGALQVVYDPVGDPFTATDLSSVIQTKIIDISETDTFSIRVPWTQPQSFLRVDPDGRKPGIAKGLNTATSDYDTDYHNGRLALKVFNPLTGPDETSSVIVLCYVHGEKMALCNPSRVQQNLSYFTAQSQIELDDEPVEYTVGTAVPIPDKIFDVNFGEVYYSLRNVMRRTCKAYTEPCDPGSITDEILWKFWQTKYPPCFGYDPNGRHMVRNIPDTEDVPFNWTHNVPFTTLAPCFVGMRGSMHWHYNANGDAPITKFMTARETDYTTAPLRERVHPSSTNYSEIPKFNYNYETGSLTGMSLVNSRTQTGLQVCIPQYNKFRFVGTDPTYYVSGRDKDDTSNEKLSVLTTATDSTSDAGKTIAIDFYCEIGTDFNLFYFLSVPRKYDYKNAQPAAADLIWSES